MPIQLNEETSYFLQNLINEIEEDENQLQEQIPIYDETWFWLTILSAFLIVLAIILAISVNDTRFWFWILLAAGIIVGILAAYNYIENNEADKKIK